jgi:hypothetical protein
MSEFDDFVSGEPPAAPLGTEAPSDADFDFGARPQRTRVRGQAQLCSPGAHARRAGQPRARAGHAAAGIDAPSAAARRCARRGARIAGHGRPLRALWAFVALCTQPIREASAAACAAPGRAA